MRNELSGMGAAFVLIAHIRTASDLLFHPRSAEFGLNLDHSPRNQLKRRYIHRKGTKWTSLAQAKARARWTIISMTEKEIMEIMAKKEKSVSASGTSRSCSPMHANALPSLLPETAMFHRYFKSCL
jgi:hypothetical protein